MQTHELPLIEGKDTAEYMLARCGEKPLSVLRACFERGGIAQPSTMVQNYLEAMIHKGLIYREDCRSRYAHTADSTPVYRCTALGGDVAILAARGCNLHPPEDAG